MLRANQAALELSLGDAAAVERALAPLFIAAVETHRSRRARRRTFPAGRDRSADCARTAVARGGAARAVGAPSGAARSALGNRRGGALPGSARSRAGRLDASAAAAEDAVARWRQLEMPVGLAGPCSCSVRCGGAAASAASPATPSPKRWQSSALTAPRSWAERATEELRRIPIRRRASRDLTPTEEQVAALVGAGRADREASAKRYS